MLQYDFAIYDEYYSDFSKCKISVSSKGNLPGVIDVGHKGAELIISTGHYSMEFVDLL